MNSQLPAFFITLAKKAPLSFFTLLLCIGLFLSLNFLGSDIEKWLYLSPLEVWQGSYWGLISNAFLHKHFFHLFFNMYWLLLLSPAIENVLGKVQWLVFVVVSAGVASAVQFSTSGGTGIGFSGVVFAFVGLMWIARPAHLQAFQIMHKGNLKIILIWFVLCFVLDALNILPIANGAHAGGLIFGCCVGLCLKHKKAIYLLLPILFIVLSTTAFLYTPQILEWMHSVGLLNLPVS